jgi:hypothetical protein
LQEIVRRGAQEPRILVRRSEAFYTDGEDAAQLVAEYGFTLDPWQSLVLNDWLARDENDAPVYLTLGLACPRQNGKNGGIEAFELYKMAICGEKVLHTAHQVKTANKAFQRLAAIFTDPAHPELNELVINVRRTNGEQAIYLKNGGLIEYSARSRGASRGNTYSVVIIDEAQEYTDEQAEALMPTLAASPTGYRQIVYAGTPPGPTSPGTVFERIRKSAITNPSKTMCWHEWSIEDCPKAGSTFDDLLDDVYSTNPAMGIRLDEDFTREEFNTMSLDGFARERLGWWSDQKAASAISQHDWKECAVPIEDVPKEGKKAFGVKFSIDGSQIALAACRIPEDTPAYVELVGMGSLSDGITWLSDFLCTEDMEETTAAIAVDGKNGADALLDKLRDIYPRQALMVPGSKGVIASASMFQEAIRERTLTHWDSPNGEQKALDDSATSSIKRPIGGDGGWGYGGDNAAAIEAAALAFWACKTTTRDPDGGCIIL